MSVASRSSSRSSARLGAGIRGVGVIRPAAPYSLVAVERRGRDEPDGEPGGRATSLVAGADAEARWRTIVDGLSRFAARPLELDEEVSRRHPDESPESRTRLLLDERDRCQHPRPPVHTSSLATPPPHLHLTLPPPQRPLQHPTTPPHTPPHTAPPLGTFAPPLDEAGNSVRGQLAATFLSRRLGLDLFVSEPDDPA